MRLKHVFLFLSMVSIAFSAPMEPAKSTLFILLDGMNPSSKGLLKDYCDHYEESEVWGKTGAAKYFQENVANTKANVYSRPYKNPADAPSAMVSELAGHGNTAQKVNCKENVAVYNASKKEFSAGSSKDMQVSSIVDEALEHWYAGKMAEMNLPLPTSNKEKIELQKKRESLEDSDKDYAPKGTYKAEFADIDPFLYAWLKNYKTKNGNYPTLETLKNERPDFLPSRYVFIANGMGGMVAREYIQGGGYLGDVDKILFINTPHEGTGFADQALLSKDPVYTARQTFNTAYAAAAAVVALIYMVADDFTQDSLISLTKVLVEAIVAQTSAYKLNDYYFKDYDKADGALWYLAQDADSRDVVYTPIRMQAGSGKADALIGGAQLLNSVGMMSNYSNPMYRILYSYGMPTIGNGRRGIADYLFQKKTHWDEDKLDRYLINAYEKAVTKEISKQLGDAIAKAWEPQIGELSRDIAKAMVASPSAWKDWTAAGFDDHSKFFANKIDKYVTDEVVSGAVSKGISFATDKVVDFALSKLMGYVDIAAVMDDIPQEIVNLISFCIEVLPETFTEKLVSTFISTYSPKYNGMALATSSCSILSSNDLEGCTFAGQSDLARTMINYSINFYDQGTYDVPTHSSYGGAVSIFNGSDVKRYPYALHTLDNAEKKYKDYRNLLAAEGYTEATRSTIDDALKIGCKALKAWALPYEICTAAKYAVNLGLSIAQMAETHVLMGSYDALEQSSNMALRASLKNNHSYTVKNAHSSKTWKVDYTDLDEMLYEKPYLSLQMVRDGSGDDAKYVPLMLGEESSDEYDNVPEILSYSDIESVYKEKYVKVNGNADGFNIKEIANDLLPVNKLSVKKLESTDDYFPLSLRDVSYEKGSDGSVVRQVSRKEYSAPTVMHEIKEYRFHIDDLRPDLIWSISFNFNMDVQFYFERNQDGTWNTIVEGTGHAPIEVEMNSPKSPILDNGLFVFRPMDIIEKANLQISDVNKQYAHNKVQPEGPNLVSVSLTNMIGLSASHQFSFYYIATKPVLREVWPTLMQTVSGLDDVAITAQNGGDPYKFVSGKVRLIKVENGQYTEVSGTETTVSLESLNDGDKDEWHLSWKARAHLGDDFISTHNIADGEYIIQWVLKAVGDDGAETEYKMNVSVFVDTKAPELVLVPSKEKLSNTLHDGSWARLLNSDPSTIRAVRVFVVPEATKKAEYVTSIYGMGSRELDLMWKQAIEKLPYGTAKVYTQSVDNAEPSALMGATLDKLLSDDPNEVDAAWSAILKSDGKTFVKGVNGKTDSVEIYIDNASPAIDVASLSTKAVKNPEASCGNCPAWTRPDTQDTVVLNSYDFLNVSFKLNNQDNTVSHDSVRIQILFMDQSQNLMRSYVYNHDFKNEKTFEFEENKNKLLPDGKYTITVIMTDEAGNSSGEIVLPQFVRVDRKLPSIDGVYPNEPVYVKAEDVDGAYAIFSSVDMEINRSAYTCYESISDGVTFSNWVNIGIVPAEQLKGDAQARLDYSMKKVGATITKGRYAVYVGCFDAAGNFSQKADVFGVGNRYPVLTYPRTGALASVIDDRLIRIEGIAPDPIVPGGNVQTAEYKIEWRKVGDTDWKQDGIRLTGKTVSSLIDNLAVWDRNGFDKGKYEIRLSVRGCKDASDSKCDWVSTSIVIELDDIDQVMAADKPTIDLKKSRNTQVPGGEPNIITSELKGVTDGSKWDLDIKVYASDPYDETRMVVADKMYTDSMVISPFTGAASAPYVDGLYVWQDKDEWTIKYVGAAKVADGYTNSALTIKYDNSAFSIVSGKKASTSGSLYSDPNQYSAEYEITAGGTQTVKIPAYNYTSSWNLDASTNDFELKFKTSKPFIIEASSIADVNTRMYCGATKASCTKYFPLLSNKHPDTGEEMSKVALLNVYPDSYKTSMAWNGLIGDAMYPSTTKVKVLAIATEKNPGNRVVMDSLQWNMTWGVNEIISDYNGVGKLIISADKDNAVMKLGEVPYEFGIAGRKSNVTVTVVDSNDHVVKLLMNNHPQVAGVKKNAISVSWDGVKDDQFASTGAGRYKFVVTATDADGHVAKREYPFDVVLAGHLIRVADDAATLTMDEAELDGDGYRFVAKADYLLKADLHAQTLDEDARKLVYYWDWEGDQYPAFYRANRFSLGIRRQRRSFPVTLVTMMDSWSYYMDWSYDPANECQKYKIKVDTVTFNYAKGGEYVYDRYEIDAGSDHIIGYDTYKPSGYEIHFKAKVFDRADYEKIRAQLDYSDERVYCSSNKYDQAFKNNFADNGKALTLLWESSETFKYYDGEKERLYGDRTPYNDCTPSADNNFVCEEKEGSDYNPHKNMLSMYISHVDGEQYYGDHGFDCTTHLVFTSFSCVNDESAQRIYAKVKFVVNDSYWNPKFGYSNLANKYVRFDHTNKTLYDPGNFFSKNDEKNYFNGTEWTHSSNYGLVAAFEAQKFEYNSTNYRNNPLNFPDETEGPTTASRYEFKFMEETEKAFDTEKGEKAIVKFKALVRRSNTLEIHHSAPYSYTENKVYTKWGWFVSDEEGIHDFDSWDIEYLSKTWADPEVAVYVAPLITAKDAIFQRTDVAIKYPWSAKDKYEPPQKFGEHKVCDVSVRDVDDSENHCFRYFPGASRLHYVLNDWTDEGWLEKFTYDGYLKNPLNYGKNFEPAEHVIENMDQQTHGVTLIASKGVNILESDYKDGVWKIERGERFPVDENPMDNETDMPPHVKAVLVISDKCKKLGWEPIVENGDVVGAYNAGRTIDTKISYVRGNDKTPVTVEIAPNAEDYISMERLKEQNQKTPLASAGWIEDLKFSNAVVYDRETNKEHAYFVASVENNDKDLIVKRNGLTPEGRISEMVTLRGKIPSKDLHWSLSFLSGNKMIPIAEGNPSEDNLPVMSMLNVDTLQGNTSFFLMYGNKDAGGDIYYKQLDVHIGKLLDPVAGGEIKSMYHNVSVNIPGGAYDSKQDMTVRTADLSDYQFSVFEGLAPVGPIVEVLPSHVFDETQPDKWPRVTAEVTKETLKELNQNPLEVRIYKPDFDSKTFVPLDVQELGFYNKGKFVTSCGDKSKNTCDDDDIPPEWDVIQVSGLTKTFSEFIVMDKGKAALVKPAEETVTKPEFACHDASDLTSQTIWAGLVNGYLDYPYPCEGESNYMLQLRLDENVVAESQGLANKNIKWEIRKNDILSKITYTDKLGSRLALYGNNGTNLQIAGPTVQTDATLPVIENASIDVEDYELQKRIVVDATLSDEESGIDTVKLELYWGGKLVETRFKVGSNLIAEDFLLTKKMASECVGCQAEVIMTVFDHGHNNVKSDLFTDRIFPFPKSLVLWYPMAERSGKIVWEAMGTNEDLNLSMADPWLAGAVLYFDEYTDVAKPSKNWIGVGKVPMSIEFRLTSNIYRGGSEYSIIGWNGSKKWMIGLKDVHELFFEYDGHRIMLPNADIQFSVQAHYVLTVEDRTLCLYKNGVLVERETLPADFVWNSYGMPIAGAFGNYKSIIGARLSNTRFYQAALSAEEVMDLYRGNVDIVDAKLEVVRAVDLPDREGLSVDQSCDLAGLAYLRQKNVNGDGSVTWKLSTSVGRYSMYVLARGYENMTSAVEVSVDGSSMGTFNVSGTGVWVSQALEGLVLNLSSGDHEITVKPVGYTGVAAFAVADAESALPANMISWNEDTWSVPDPKIQVEMAYPAFTDKTWMHANFRLKNISDENLNGVRLRYYYRGEGSFVATKVDYPSEANMSIFADAGDVYYAEMELTEAIPLGGSPYYGNGPQIGLHRTDDYPVWNFEDDPSYDANAVNGSFNVTDKIALLDAEGNLISKFSCYDAAGPVKIKTPSVRALALDEKGNSSNGSTIAMVVENVGEVPVQGFEIRYYVRDSERPEFDLHDVGFAENPSLVESGDGLYYASFTYKNVILNPGEKTNYGNGAKFTLRHTDWQNWDPTNDPSHYGLSYSFAQADSIVIMDLNGNLLWGSVPKAEVEKPTQPEEQNEGGIITVESDGIMINITTEGYYALEQVDALGNVVSRIYNGHWNVGEQFIPIQNVNLEPGLFLMLRQGTTVKAKVLVK